MTTNRIPNILLNYKPRGHRDTVLPDDPQLSGGTFLLKSETKQWSIPLKMKKKKIKKTAGQPPEVPRGYLCSTGS
jgi:hypothetical protein